MILGVLTQSAPVTGEGDAAQPVSFMVAYDDPELMDVILGTGALVESYRPSDSEQE